MPATAEIPINAIGLIFPMVNNTTNPVNRRIPRMSNAPRKFVSDKSGCKTITDQSCRIDGYRPWNRLSQGKHIHDFPIFNPSPFLNHFPMDEGNHGVTASKREQPYLEERCKQVPIPNLQMIWY
jgi:hypothetical protein